MKLHNRNSLFARLLLSLLSLMVVLIMVEVGHFTVNTVRHRVGDGDISLFEWCGDCPEIYRLNPGHPEVDARGFRNCRGGDFSGGGTSGVIHRLMILGDSVTYGYGVECEEAFPHLLAVELNSGANSGPDTGFFQVINGGVDGYGTYNEVQQFIQRGRPLNPEVVVLALVLNDVANPRLHWAEGGRNLVDFPPAAIPNIEYDRRHAIPVLAQWKREQFGQRFFVVRTISRLWRTSPLAPTSGEGNFSWPTHITGEDDLPITVLTDSRSPESGWLEIMLGKLKTVVRENGGTLMVMVLPLSYQLDPSYPHLPQRNISEICLGLGLPYLDLLPTFRAQGGQSLFLGRSQGEEDIWHLSSEGHLVTALALENFLRESGSLAW